MILLEGRPNFPSIFAFMCNVLKHTSSSLQLSCLFLIIKFKWVLGISLSYMHTNAFLLCRCNYCNNVFLLHRSNKAFCYYINFKVDSLYDILERTLPYHVLLVLLLLLCLLFLVEEFVSISVRFVREVL